MGKQGPCYHCGVTSTPLWRNGPPDKPILCNACGSRWRTKGTLVNYTPLHARSEPDEFEDRRVLKMKAISIKNKEAKLLKRKDNYEHLVVGGNISGSGGGGGGGWFAPGHHNQSLFKGLDEDTSNRSSSGSAISNSDSCMQLCSADASDLTGPSQSSVVWDRDANVPSRKRTCVYKPKQSSVEKLTRDLYTILHEQRSYFSGSSEEDLIFESDTPMVSVEIGHGSVLIRHPNTNKVTREEDSEASSLSFDTKHQYNRDNDEKVPILTNHKSPLCHVDLKDVVNFEVFASHMTNDEQRQLVKYLPPIDNAQFPNSLKSMFDSPQFEENLLSFQKLLADGTFDPSDSAHAMKSETLKTLALCNVTKSKWLEQYNLLQDEKCKKDGMGSVNVQRSLNTESRSFPGSKKSSKEVVDTDGTGFSPKSLFALPPDNSSLMFDFSRYTDDQDLLLDVPSHTAFPQAELLSTSSFVGATSSSLN